MKPALMALFVLMCGCGSYPHCVYLHSSMGDKFVTDDGIICGYVDSTVNEGWFLATANLDPGHQRMIYGHENAIRYISQFCPTGGTR